MRWPGKIPANTVCDELTTTMDIMPTFAHLGKAPMPNDRIIDGHDIWMLMSGKPSAISPYKAFYYYHIDQLQAVRSGKWKLWLPLELKRGHEDRKNTPAILIDLSVDLLEENNLADDHPDVVRRLMGYADEARADLGDMDREGSGQRPAGFISHTTPRVVD